jgi:malic enzyme
MGASSSQKPSAADANTGPNSPLTASVTAIVAANAAQGKMARADRQVALVHCATVRYAFKITLMTMAPVMAAAKTATKASLIACKHIAGRPACPPVHHLPLQLTRAGWDQRFRLRRFWAGDSRGLLTDDSAALRDFQQPYARPAAEVATWSRQQGDSITLADVVANASPTMLLGTSTQSGAFTEGIVRQMASTVDRPIIMPLSNPTWKAEAVPEDLSSGPTGARSSPPAAIPAR